MTDRSPTEPRPTEPSQHPPSRRLGAPARLWYRTKRWMYRGGRPRPVARAINAASAWLYARRWLRLPQAATLEVAGRRTGRTVTLPVAIAELDGHRHLVSMLGNGASWVLNARAANGEAVLVQRGRRLAIRLVDVPVEARAPILRRYLAVAPGARPHIPVPWRAPVEEFVPIANDYPVFRIEPRR